MDGGHDRERLAHFEGAGYGQAELAFVADQFAEAVGKTEDALLPGLEQLFRPVQNDSGIIARVIAITLHALERHVPAGKLAAIAGDADAARRFHVPADVE